MSEYIKKSEAIEVLEFYESIGAYHDYRLKESMQSIKPADVVEVNPELQKVVKSLCKEYDNAKKNPIVRDPLAYALFQTWKAVDGKGENHDIQRKCDI